MDAYYIGFGVILGALLSLFVGKMISWWDKEKQKELNLKKHQILWDLAVLMDCITVPASVAVQPHPELSDKQRIDFDKLSFRIGKLTDHEKKFEKFIQENKIVFD